MTAIAFVEQHEGKWEGSFWDGVSSFASSEFKRNTEQDLRDIFNRFGDPVYVTKLEFYQRYWTFFFAPRLDHEPTWGELKELATQDPLQMVRRRLSQREPGLATGHQRWEERQAGIRRLGDRYRRKTQGQGGGDNEDQFASESAVPERRASKSPLFSFGEEWIAPVAFAKRVGMKPQYVYNAIYHGKIKSKGERPKMIRVDDGLWYFFREKRGPNESTPVHEPNA